MLCLFSVFSAYKILMCLFHLILIIKRYLSKRPCLIAARVLKELVGSITSKRLRVFVDVYRQWKRRWELLLCRRTSLKSWMTLFSHKRLRSAMLSVDFYLPFLFTYLLPVCKGMPNSNYKFEGSFTELKKNLNYLCGMSRENRKRFISGFFLALSSKLELDL